MCYTSRFCKYKKEITNFCIHAVIADAQVLSAKAKLTTLTDISLYCNSTLNKMKHLWKSDWEKTYPKIGSHFFFFFFQFNVTTSNLRFSWSWWLGANKRDEWYRANYQPLKFHFIVSPRLCGCTLLVLIGNHYVLKEIMHSIQCLVLASVSHSKNKCNWSPECKLITSGRTVLL